MNEGMPHLAAAWTYAQQFSSAIQGSDHTSASLQIAVLVGGALFALGILLGHSLTEQAFDQRSRRQAETQRWLNQQFDELEARQQADALLRDTRQQATTHPAHRPTPIVINE